MSPSTVDGPLAGGVVAQRACPRCLRRAWLLEAAAGRLEQAFRDRSAMRDVLALDDAAFIAATGGRTAQEVQAAYDRFDLPAARARCVAAGLSTTCPHDPGFPPALRTGPGAPRALFVAGGLERLAGWVGAGRAAVAVVGTRRASAEALEVATALGRGLAAAGVTVVSGMALGVDAAAHAGALAVGGPTVAVLASGADVAYPRTKHGLHAQLAASAVVLSEMPPGSEPRRWAFPARNRTIAGLAACTIVVEAAERSGSLITADFATALGREVGAVPGRVTSPRTGGSNLLLRDGAHVVLSVTDVLDLLGLPDAAPGVEVAAAPAGGDPLEPSARAVLERVAAGADTLDALAATPAEADAALEALAELEAVGAVRRAPGGRYVARLPGP